MGIQGPRFRNTYAALPERFFTAQDPVPVPEPRLFALNEPLAAELGLDPDWLRSEAGVAALAGNAVPEGAAPLAQVYAGHQFGGWVPQLGDGRAILLGEIDAPDGRHFDLQLKGSGQTPYSRMGDGRAWLGPVMREFLVSEAMSALGVPTTRALAIVTTGQRVQREAAFPGAVLTRVASSHVRVGTFQYFASRGDIEGLQALTAHVIDRHYPDADGPGALLDKVVTAQAELIAHWMSVGFIHGVMNTDNMAISGETIDYGPCAFLDEYHPAKVFSSIDQQGRYAFANQPAIAAWNLAQFATCLLPLIGEQEAALEQASASVNAFVPQFEAAWLRRFAAKIGIVDPADEDGHLVSELLSHMAETGADFTRTFTALRRGERGLGPEGWDDQRRARLAGQSRDAAEIMARANPVVIPRNHRIEDAIRAAVDGNDAPFRALHRVLAEPYRDDPDTVLFQEAPEPGERVTRTFCGT